MLERLALSLGLTVILEFLFAFGWGINGRDFWLIIAMNVLTNPLVVLWNSYSMESGLLISTVLPELAAIVTEAVLLLRLGKNIHYPVLLGVCINVFSYFTGMIIQIFI